MITVKLTRKEAECAMDAIAQIIQEYIETWDYSTQQINGGKRFYNSLDSAFKKIHKAIKADSFGVPPSKLEEKQSEMLRSWGVPKA